MEENGTVFVLVHSDLPLLAVTPTVRNIVEHSFLRRAHTHTSTFPTQFTLIYSYDCTASSIC